MTSESSLDPFTSRMVMRFDLHEDEVVPSALLGDDLQFDSFDTLLLILWVEEQSGYRGPFVDLPDLVTVGDAYAYFDWLRVQAIAAVAES